jgi:hypothetical protein
MDIRETIELVETAQDHTVMVKGKKIFIDGKYIGEFDGGRWRHKGKITPTSGYYLKLKNGTELYRRESTDKFPWRSGIFSYADELVRQVGYDASEILDMLGEDSSEIEEEFTQEFTRDKNPVSPAVRAERILNLLRDNQPVLSPNQKATLLALARPTTKFSSDRYGTNLDERVLGLLVSMGLVVKTEGLRGVVWKLSPAGLSAIKFL